MFKSLLKLLEFGLQELKLLLGSKGLIIKREKNDAHKNREYNNCQAQILPRKELVQYHQAIEKRLVNKKVIYGNNQINHGRRACLMISHMSLKLKISDPC